MTDGIPSDNNNCDDKSSIGDDITAILAHITKQKILPMSHDVRSILASAHKRMEANIHFQGQGNRNQRKESIVIDGKRYIQADKHEITYNIFNLEKVNEKIATLVDGGANGGLAGEDVRIIETTGRTADVSGIDNHTIRDLTIATVSGVVESHLGPVCLIMHQ